MFVVSGGHFPLNETRETRENTRGENPIKRSRKATVLPLEIHGTQPKDPGNLEGIRNQQTA